MHNTFSAVDGYLRTEFEPDGRKTVVLTVWRYDGPTTTWHMTPEAVHELGHDFLDKETDSLTFEAGGESVTIQMAQVPRQIMGRHLLDVSHAMGFEGCTRKPTPSGADRLPGYGSTDSVEPPEGAYEWMPGLSLLVSTN